jgi:hypothetical protein
MNRTPARNLPLGQTTCSRSRRSPPIDPICTDRTGVLNDYLNRPARLDRPGRVATDSEGSLRMIRITLRVQDKQHTLRSEFFDRYRDRMPYSGRVVQLLRPRWKWLSERSPRCSRDHHPRSKQRARSVMCRISRDRRLHREYALSIRSRHASTCGSVGWRPAWLSAWRRAVHAGTIASSTSCSAADRADLRRGDPCYSVASLPGSPSRPAPQHRVRGRPEPAMRRHPPDRSRPGEIPSGDAIWMLLDARMTRIQAEYRRPVSGSSA